LQTFLSQQNFSLSANFTVYVPQENSGNGEPVKALKKKAAGPPASKVAKAFGSPIYIGFEKE
jgi:hypothetical protein